MIGESFGLTWKKHSLTIPDAQREFTTLHDKVYGSIKRFFLPNRAIERWSYLNTTKKWQQYVHLQLAFISTLPKIQKRLRSFRHSEDI
ncbi:hypothetical protein DMR_40560 [Solidesulfovibrio magneticus RS-1]|uniref:Uncharacterized protein n=1 Tax=Solidesulfovibrio magneticus (strain ATCC 700980 / DSM 13731 / RS-1) TaxID=573370 RepID=C4XP46_SOLM1|nr:hypothetical protein DMR_40560 [Solidesulfovibrio magneticus RS-1]